MVHGFLGGYMCAVFEIVVQNYFLQHYQVRLTIALRLVEIVWRVCVKPRYEGWKPVAMIAPLRYLISMKRVGCRAVTNSQLFN